MEWPNDKVILLIDLYRDRPVLWNSKMRDHKDRNKRCEAFVEIAASFGVAQEEVERKLKNLVSHFSREIKKERDTMKCGSEEAYKSKWFAYQSMEFLKARNRPRGMTDTQDPLATSTQSKSAPKKKKRGFKPKHKVSKSKLKHAATQAISIMKDIQAGKSARDQYTAFGEQIGMQIRDLPSLYAKKVVKQIISTVLFDAEMGKYDYLPTTSLQPSPVAHMYSQPPTYGVSMSTSIPSTNSISQSHRVPKSGHHPQHSARSPADSCDPETTDSDSIDTLLMGL